MAITESTAQELVEPTLAVTKTGVRPAATSSPIAAARSAASKAYPLSSAAPSPPRVGTNRTFPPSPAMLAAFCTEECAWGYDGKHERCIRAASVQRAVGQGGRQDRCQRPRERVLLHKPFSGRRNNVGRGRVSGSAVRQSAVSALAKLFDTPSNNLGGSGTIKTADKKGGGREGEDHT